MNEYFPPMTKGDPVCQKCGHKPGGSETAVEQLDAGEGERSRADVDKKTLRPIGDLLGHRNKKERTINKPGQLPEITKEESGNSLGP